MMTFVSIILSFIFVSSFIFIALGLFYVFLPMMKTYPAMFSNKDSGHLVTKTWSKLYMTSRSVTWPVLLTNSIYERCISSSLVGVSNPCLDVLFIIRTMMVWRGNRQRTSPSLNTNSVPHYVYCRYSSPHIVDSLCYLYWFYVKFGPWLL